MKTSESFPVPTPESINPSYTGMIEVTKDSFFGSVGRLNCHPYPIGRENGTYWHASRWRMCDDHFTTFFAIDTGNGVNSDDSRFFVTGAFFRSNPSLIRVA